MPCSWRAPRVQLHVCDVAERARLVTAWRTGACALAGPAAVPLPGVADHGRGARGRRQRRQPPGDRRTRGKRPPWRSQVRDTDAALVALRFGCEACAAWLRRSCPGPGAVGCAAGLGPPAGWSGPVRGGCGGGQRGRGGRGGEPRGGGGGGAGHPPGAQVAPHARVGGPGARGMCAEAAPPRLAQTRVHACRVPSQPLSFAASCLRGVRGG